MTKNTQKPHDTHDTLDLKHELGRKAIHLNSLLIVLIYIFFDKQTALYFLIVALILFLEVEYFRIEWGFKIPLLGRFFRAKEKHTLGGEVFFVIGSIIAISVFSREIAIAAILMTTFGDMAAALFGKAFGRTWIPGLKNRAVEGCAAEFFVNIIIGYIIFIYMAAEGYSHPGIIIIIMALTATIVETLVNRIDDNLLIPVFAGFNGQLVLVLFELMG